MRICIVFMVLFFSQAVFAQQSKFFVKKTDQGLYIDHKVQSKENWYSVGRIYFISPKEIAKFNATSIEKGLGIGQVLRIPLNDINFSQNAYGAKDGIPVYHKVQPKETLFRLAAGFGGNVDDIKKWNGLKSEQLNAGAEIIIGYLKPPDVAPSTEQSKAEQTNPVAEPKPQSKPQPQPQLQPVIEPVPSVESKPKPLVESKPVGESISKPIAAGQFSALFEQQSREGKQQKLENPVYGLFKSTSGWQDGKYYVLLNNVVPGTIVKLMAKATGKQVFAKVLGSVPNGKESEGMMMRISNATHAALGFSEGAAGNVEVYWYN